MELERALQAHEDAKLLFSDEGVEQGIAELSDTVAKDYKHKNPLVLCVMNGGLYLTGQLLRHWNFPLTLDYVHATRYRLKTLGRDHQGRSNNDCQANQFSDRLGSMTIHRV